MFVSSSSITSPYNVFFRDSSHGPETGLTGSSSFSRFSLIKGKQIKKNKALLTGLYKQLANFGDSPFSRGGGGGKYS